MRSPSLLGRAVLALTLTVVFYVFATAIGLVMVLAPIAWLLVTDGPGPGGGYVISVALFSFVAGLAILWAIVPRREKFRPPGPVLTAQAHPQLFALIEDVARETRQAPPATVYLDGDTGAAVGGAGGFLGFGARRILVLGLPLMEILSEAELRAVIAHEFGHFAGRDSKFGAWTWRTREALGRAVASLHDENEESIAREVVVTPFKFYASLFARLTSAVSRRQEFAADRVSAAVAGAEATVLALRRSMRPAPAIDDYWQTFVIPALQLGAQPPIAEGWRRILESPDLQADLETAYAHWMRDTSSDTDASHPTPAERIRALGADPDWPAGLDPLPHVPATRLLDLPGAERALVGWMLGDDAPVEALPWEELGEALYLPGHRELAEAVADGLGDLTVASGLGTLIRSPRSLEFVGAGAGYDDARAAGTAVIGPVTVAALARAGFRVDALPGRPLECRRGEHVLAPLAAVDAAIAGRLLPNDWRALCEAAGVAELPLAPPQPPRAARASATENLRS